MKQITITTATGPVTYPLAKGAVPSEHAFNADEPIAAPSAPAPITADESTKKTKKAKKA